MGEEHQEVYFLPWARIPKSVCIGPVTFWPYLSEASQRINDEPTKQFLDKYFDRFVGHEGSPKNWITICSYGDRSFPAIDEKEIKELRNAVDVLAFIEIASKVKQAVCANDTSLGPPNADTFELSHRDIELEYPGIIIKTRYSTTFYFKPDELLFCLPYSVLQFSWGLDEHLIKGFSKLFSYHEQALPVFRSMEWFRRAHGSMGPMVYFSLPTALIMMSIAFETLLEIERGKKTEIFAGIIDSIIGYEGLKKDERGYDGNEVTDYTLAGCWAWDFYTLRNKIVHGDEVSNEEFAIPELDWISHLEVADLVLYELIIRKLFELECIGEEVNSCKEAFEGMFGNGQEEMPLEPVLRWFFGFNKIHKALGWIDDCP